MRGMVGEVIDVDEKEFNIGDDIEVKIPCRTSDNATWVHPSKVFKVAKEKGMINVYVCNPDNFKFNLKS